METPNSGQRFTPLTHFNELLKELNTVDYGLLSPYIYQLDSVPYKVISHQLKSEEDIRQEVVKNLPYAPIWLIDSIVNDPELYLRQPPPEEVISDWDNAHFVPYNRTDHGRHHTHQFFNDDWMLVFAKQPRFTSALDDLISLSNDARQMRFRQFALLMDNLTNMSKPFWNEISKESKLLYIESDEERERLASFYKATGQIDRVSTLPAKRVVDLEPLSWSLRKLSEFHRSLDMSGINTINVPPTNGEKELYFGRRFLDRFDLLIYKKVQLISEFVEMVRLVTGELPISSLLGDKNKNQSPISQAAPLLSNDTVGKPEATKHIEKEIRSFPDLLTNNFSTIDLEKLLVHLKMRDGQGKNIWPQGKKSAIHGIIGALKEKTKLLDTTYVEFETSLGLYLGLGTSRTNTTSNIAKNCTKKALSFLNQTVTTKK